LVECLRDLLCDLLLMLAVTYRSLSEILAVEEQGKGFQIGKCWDRAQFTVCLATQMLWFLWPKVFLWKVDNRLVLCISEMTKKIKHKGVNNQFLCETGWVQMSVGCPSPYNNEIKLQEVDKLLKYCEWLLKSHRKPAQFIA
jgi:hypothetical protein